jgi:hypothetical protein
MSAFIALLSPAARSFARESQTQEPSNHAPKGKRFLSVLLGALSAWAA